MALNLEEAISKYGGEDEAYKLKLKSTIRETMGYSNYRARLDGQVNKPLDTGDIKGLSIAGMASNRAAKMGIEENNINQSERMMNSIDSTAGSLANAQAAREKSASEKAARDKEGQIDSSPGAENSGSFSPEDELDREIIKYKNNPFNDDGSIKSLQQFESEQAAIYNSKFSGDQKLYPGSYVNDRVKRRFESDYTGKEEEYQKSYKFERWEKMGLTKGQVKKRMLQEDLLGQAKAGALDPYIEATLKETDPTFYNELQALKANPALMEALQLEPTGDNPFTTKIKDNKTFTELQSDFPEIDATILKKQAKPLYQASLRGDIYKLFSDAKHKINSDIYEVDDIEFTPENLSEIMDKDSVKSFLLTEVALYEGILTKGEIESELIRSINAGNPLRYIESFHQSETSDARLKKTQEEDNIINSVSDNSYRNKLKNILGM